MKNFAFSIIISIVLLWGNTAAYSKCSLIEFYISGKITSSETKTGIGEAQILVFLDENDSTRSKGYFTKFPDFFLTDKDGGFVAISYFDPFERQAFFFWGGDVCTKRPQRVEVVIIKEGFVSKRKTFKNSEFAVWEETGKFKIRLPEIYLNPS